jgi:hypothetical protein
VASPHDGLHTALKKEENYPFADIRSEPTNVANGSNEVWDGRKEKENYPFARYS